MDVEGALLSCTISPQGKTFKTENTLFSASGFIFGDRWVLSHGSLISPLKITRKIISSQIKGAIKPDSRYSEFPDIYVTHKSDSRRKCLSIDSNTPTQLVEPDNSQGQWLSSNVTVSRGKVKYIWKCPLLCETVDTLLSTWTIGHKQGDAESQDETGKQHLSIFVLVDIGGSKEDVNVLEALQLLYRLIDKQPLSRGEQLYVDSTPFGNEVFLNSRTAGVVCNVVGADNCLVMCDASSALGSEGAPAFLINGTLFGILASTLSWWRGEWVGLTLVARLQPVLKNLLYPDNDTIYEPLLAKPQLPILSILDVLDTAVVLVRCGEAWGSGVSLGKGYVITCSHVVKNHNSYRVSVYCKGKSARSKVIFKSADGMAYDLALLHTSSEPIVSLLPVNFARRAAIKGETVVAVGFPYFSEKNIKNIKPTVTKGHINKVTPHMLQTSCCVQSGCSGGAVMRLYKSHSGESVCCELLGIIVCNVKSDTATSILKNFEDNQQDVQSLWRLQLNKYSHL